MDTLWNSAYQVEERNFVFLFGPSGHNDLKANWATSNRRVEKVESTELHLLVKCDRETGHGANMRGKPKKNTERRKCRKSND